VSRADVSWLAWGVLSREGRERLTAKKKGKKAGETIGAYDVSGQPIVSGRGAGSVEKRDNKNLVGGKERGTVKAPANLTIPVQQRTREEG